MATISSKTGIPLHPHNDTQGLPWHHYKPVMDYEGGWARQIIIQLTSRDELTTIHRFTSGAGLVINGHTAALRCSSDFVEL